MITRTFKLCLNAGTGSAPYINVSQYDEGETWLFELYSETGERYIPTTGAIVGVKSDGHGIANTGTVDSEGRVVIAETQQMTASAGRAIYELSIDGLTHGTANFIVAVERKPTDDAVMSDSDLSLIQEAIDSAEVIVEVIGDGDPSEVIGEHVDAWLDTHPEATTTVQDGAITAPKINQSLWDKLLVSEEASGNPASFDDGADDVPVSSLKVALEPVQLGSGDPSPSNVRPIIASNGKNLLNSAFCVNRTNKGITTVLNADGSITLTGTADGSSRYWSATDTLALTLPSGTYTLSPSNVRIEKVGGGYSNGTFTLAEPTTYQNVYFTLTNGATYNTTYYPQLELGSSASAYQPYQGIMVERTGKNLAYVSSGNNIVIANCTKGVTYTFSLRNSGTCGFNLKKNSNSGQTVFGQNAVSSSVISATFTADEDFKLFLNGFGSGGVTFVDAASEYQLEVGTKATEYEEYIAPTSYPYTLGQSVYGGSVDLATGVLTVDRVYHTVTEYSNWVYSTDGNFFYRTFNNKRAGLSNVISDEYETKQRSTWASDDDAVISGNKNTGQIYICDTRFTSAADFMANATASICYELATPQTIQLTPTQVKTLLGYNNISSSGTVDVVYHADTKLYVDKMTAVDNNIIAPTEADFVATRNYTVNDLVIVADTLYKVTSNIANGGTITPNSNVTQTTLSALIKALS